MIISYNPITTLFQHHLIAAASTSIVVDSVHPFMTTLDPSPDGCFQQDNAPCQKPHNLKLVSGTCQ